ncbi:MAG: hypothetical protein GX442_25665 [Candidatus Riflebacteria bacterium]|nr:hypothetical protein [Candidatus Riflebacteria bacterium]
MAAWRGSRTGRLALLLGLSLLTGCGPGTPPPTPAGSDSPAPAVGASAGPAAEGRMAAVGAGQPAGRVLHPPPEELFAPVPPAQRQGLHRDLLQEMLTRVQAEARLEEEEPGSVPAATPSGRAP